ncbi:hypothetical protein ACUOFC_25765, partial [Escherichia sp. TWPC-MK]
MELSKRQIFFHLIFISQPNRINISQDKVTDGLHALNSNAGIGKLVDGSGKVTDGLNTLNSKT